MITRNNYEEYFLLYVDNELSAAEKNAVEEFVQQNPDLANELSMIQDAVFKPEKNISFNNKESLLKNVAADSIISLNNYEEYFLLHVDNELDITTKKLVEEFLSKNPSLQNEWNILQQTKIEADHSIVFEGKESLYKKEERRRIVPFAWIASAAAVAVLLVTGFLFFNKKDIPVKGKTASFAQTDSIKKDKSTQNTNPSVDVTSAKVDTLNNTKTEKENIATKEEIKSERQQPTKTVESIQKKIEKENNKEQEDLTVVNSIDNIKKQNDEAIPQETKPIDIISTNTSSSDVSVAPKKLVVLVDKPDEKFNTDDNSSYAISTTTVTDDPTSNDDSEKKNKLRGIFRRVSRVFNKANADDDSSKRSVSIGSFQIALK